MLQYLTTSLCNYHRLCQSRLSETPDEVLSLQLRSPSTQVLSAYEGILTRKVDNTVFLRVYSSDIVHLEEGVHTIRIITDDGRYHFLIKSAYPSESKGALLNEFVDRMTELNTLLDELENSRLYYNVVDLQATYDALVMG